MADPLQAVRLPRQADPERFDTLYAELVRRRTGPGAVPPQLLDWDHVQALRRSGALHYF